jgi:hypothetical protein
MRRAVAAFFCAAVFAAGGAIAQQRPPALSEAAAAIVGTWEFSNADRDRICTLTLKSDPGAHGLRLEFDKDCANIFPIVKDVTAWRYSEGDLLRLIDARGRSIIEFSEVENGMFEAPTPGIGLLFLQNAAAAGPPPRRAEQVAGEWSLNRGDKPVCSLTLSGNPVGSAGDEFALRLQPGCDAAVARFNPAIWRIDRGELILSAANGQSWRFEPADQASWRRVPEATEPVTLVRR